MITAAGSLALAILVGCGGDSRRAESEGGQTVAATPTTQATQRLQSGTGGRSRRSRIRRGARTSREWTASAAISTRSATRLESASAGSADVQEASKAYEDTITSGEAELRRIQAVPPPPGESQLLRANVFDVISQQLALRGEIRNALPSLDIDTTSGTSGPAR